MKYFKYIVIIVSLAVIGTTQAVVASETGKDNETACSRYLVTASLLNVRERPGLENDIIGGLLKGKSVCVFSFSGNWSKIDKGWISSKYIVADPEAVETAEVVEVIEEITGPDLNGTKDDVTEGTKYPVTTKEQEDNTAQTEPLEPVTSPSLSQEENIVEVEKSEKATDTEEEVKEVEKTEEVEEVVETEVETTKAKKTEELPVEKEDKTTTDYLKQIRTQEGVRGTSYIYILEGNGDKCEIMILEKNTILVNTCKPAKNESGEKMLCTWNKKMCKTEAQILKDIKE